MYNREKVISALTNQIQASKDHISAWKETLDKNPSYAFQWSNDIFLAAAKIEVLSSVLSWIDRSPDTNLDEIVASFPKMVIQKARDPKHSTSPTANLVDQYITQVWAELASEPARFFR